MQTQDVLREARPWNLPGLRELERAAGAPFRGLGMAAVADDEPPSVTELSAFQADGRAWVCTDTDDVPVAYLLVDVVDRSLPETVPLSDRRLGRRAVRVATTRGGPG